MNQEQLHSLRDNILEDTASGVGFRNSVVPAIVDLYPEIITEILKEDYGEHLLATAQKGDNASVMNIFVTEAVRLMNFEEFQEIAKYFFGYVQTEEEYLAEPVEISRADFIEFTQGNRTLDNLQSSKKDLGDRAFQQTHSYVPNNREVVAYDPINETMAVLEASDYYVEPYLEEFEGFINDYRSSLSNEEQVVNYLFDYGAEGLKEAIRANIEGFEYEYEVHDYLVELLEEYPAEALKFINEHLENRELMVHTARGYSQGDVWDLYYLRDSEIETRESVEDWLEHTVGAYYRGSLTELTIYDEAEEVVESYMIDRELFWDNAVDQVKELTEVDTYIDLESAISFEKQGIALTEVAYSEWNDLSHEERQEFLEEHIEEKVQEKGVR